MQTPLFIGIDGGGTKTEVVVHTVAGEQVGHAESGPTNLDSVLESVAAANLRAGIETALGAQQPEQLLMIHMGASGVDTAQEQQRSQTVFEKALHGLPVEQLSITNDADIALASGSDHDNALILIAGTGSNCIGYNQAGQRAKAGGMGLLLADQGSGYAIGRQVLRQAVRSFDGRSVKTLLEELVTSEFHISSLSDLKQHVYNPDIPKDQVAALSKLCSQAAEAGDQVAIDIFTHAVTDLVAHVSAVLRTLALESTPADCVCTGSIHALPWIKTHLAQHLGDLYPQVQLVYPSKRPVSGAVKLARQNWEATQ